MTWGLFFSLQAALSGHEATAAIVAKAESVGVVLRAALALHYRQHVLQTNVNSVIHF